MKIKKEELKYKEKFIAIKTTSVYCNKVFNLIENKEIPKDFPKEFITSLLNNKTIKRG